jgi:hypothetical protein
MAQSKRPPKPFSADRPIRSKSEDLLGRSAFAESLATVVEGWTGNDSLVVALYGPWGIGKTSLAGRAQDKRYRAHSIKLFLLQRLLVGKVRSGCQRAAWQQRRVTPSRPIFPGRLESQLRRQIRRTTGGETKGDSQSRGADPRLPRCWKLGEAAGFRFHSVSLGRRPEFLVVQVCNVVRGIVAATA